MQWKKTEHFTELNNDWDMNIYEDVMKKQTDQLRSWMIICDLWTWIERSWQVIWCFTPCQLVQIYQGNWKKLDLINDEQCWKTICMWYWLLHVWSDNCMHLLALIQHLNILMPNSFGFLFWCIIIFSWQWQTWNC